MDGMSEFSVWLGDKSGFLYDGRVTLIFWSRHLLLCVGPVQPCARVRRGGVPRGQGRVQPDLHHLWTCQHL